MESRKWGGNKEGQLFLLLPNSKIHRLRRNWQPDLSILLVPIKIKVIMFLPSQLICIFGNIKMINIKS